MPLPKTNNVGTIIKFLKKDKPDMSHDQMVAIALEHAKKYKADGGEVEMDVLYDENGMPIDTTKKVYKDKMLDDTNKQATKLASDAAMYGNISKGVGSKLLGKSASTLGSAAGKAAGAGAGVGGAALGAGIGVGGYLAGELVDKLEKEDTKGGKAAEGALKAAGTGASIGSVIMPGIGTAIGAGVGALAGGISGFFGQKKVDKENAANEVAQARAMKLRDIEKEKGKYRYGGDIKGSGTAKSDSIGAMLDKGGFVVPAENAGKARKIRMAVFGDKGNKYANLKSGDVAVKVSDEEHYFTPVEADLLRKYGINLDELAPNADGGKGAKKGGYVKGYAGGSWVDDSDSDVWRKTSRGNKTFYRNSDTGEEISTDDYNNMVQGNKSSVDMTSVADTKPAGDIVTDPLTMGRYLNKGLNYDSDLSDRTLNKSQSFGKDIEPSKLAGGNSYLSAYTPKDDAGTDKKEGTGKGLETGIALGQIGAGLAGTLLHGKRPEDRISEDITGRLSEADKAAQYGFTPREESLVSQGIESRRRTNVKNVLNLAGGSSGVAMGNIQAAGARAGQETLASQVESDRLQQQKQRYADTLGFRVSEMKRRLYDDKAKAWQQNEQAYAQLLRSGIANIFGIRELQGLRRGLSSGDDVAPYLDYYNYNNSNRQYSR